MFTPLTQKPPNFWIGSIILQYFDPDLGPKQTEISGARITMEGDGTQTRDL